MVRGAVRVSALFGIAMAAATAHAEPRAHDSPDAYFESGARHYNLGQFQDAIADFERAYQLEPSPILLFNLAQCQRQLRNHERALFLYRRYLEQAPHASNRADVNRRIGELELAVQQDKADAAVRARATAAAASAERRSDLAAHAAATGAAAPGGRDAPGRGPWSLAAAVAPAFIWFSGRSLDTPLLFAARVEAAYALLARDRAALHLGLDAQFAAVPFNNLDTAARQSSSFWGLLATLLYLRRVRPDVALGASAGAGLIWWSGLADGNPFTVDGKPSSGPVPLPTAMVDLRAEYALTRGLFVTVAPELLLSKTTSAGLSGAMSAVWRFDFTVGVGYTF